MLAGEPTSPFEGTWLLDLEASNDPTPALERLGLSWAVRKAARTVRPTSVITWGDGRFRVEVRSLFVNRGVDVVLDDHTPTRDDFVGRPLSYVSHLEDGAVVSRGAVLSASGEMIHFDTRRFIDAEGRMVVRFTLHPEDGPPLVVSRVYRWS